MAAVVIGTKRRLEKLAREKAGISPILHAVTQRTAQQEEEHQKPVEVKSPSDQIRERHAVSGSMQQAMNVLVAERKLREAEQAAQNEVERSSDSYDRSRQPGEISGAEPDCQPLPLGIIRFQLIVNKVILQNREAKSRRHRSGWLRYQVVACKLYNGTLVQVFIAGLIFLNFVINALEKQVPPIDEADSDKPFYYDVFRGFELFFTAIFTIELVVNMYAHWWWPFWSSSWNWFDFLVVAISLISLGLSDLPGVSILRLMRAFRVFRLFKRLDSLRKLLKGLENAIPGCANAFAILILVTAIYSILGNQFFGADHPDYFDRFSTAFFSLFQVMTGDSWAEAIARPLIEKYPHAALYFITYILLSSVMLVNVAVAVLLQEMDKSVTQDSEQDDTGDMLRQVQAFHEDTEAQKANPVEVELSVLDQVNEGLEDVKKMMAEYKFDEDVKSVADLMPGTSTAGKALNDDKPEEKPKGPPHPIFKYQTQVMELYNADNVQIFIACLIFANFVVNAAEAQVVNVEANKLASDIFKVFEYFFTIVFTIELIVNMYAHWLYAFWESSWNIFDFIVVVVSLMSIFLSSLPGIATLRLMRAFRVFRLFKKLKSLRIIIGALEAAVPGCANAFSILILVTAIYAILGVQFFATLHPQRRYFKNFSAAFFTLFQVMTGDSWSEAVARPIIDAEPAYAIYFISYILICAVLLLNVVIAVLLEKYTTASDDADGDEEESRKGMMGNKHLKPLPAPPERRSRPNASRVDSLQDDLNFMKSDMQLAIQGLEGLVADARVSLKKFHAGPGRASKKSALGQSSFDKAVASMAKQERMRRRAATMDRRSSDSDRAFNSLDLFGADAASPRRSTDLRSRARADLRSKSYSHPARPYSGDPSPQPTPPRLQPMEEGDPEQPATPDAALLVASAPAAAARLEQRKAKALVFEDEGTARAAEDPQLSRLESFPLDGLNSLNTTLDETLHDTDIEIATIGDLDNRYVGRAAP